MIGSVERAIPIGEVERGLAALLARNGCTAIPRAALEVPHSSRDDLYLAMEKLVVSGHARPTPETVNWERDNVVYREVHPLDRALEYCAAWVQEHVGKYLRR